MAHEESGGNSAGGGPLGLSPEPDATEQFARAWLARVLSLLGHSWLVTLSAIFLLVVLVSAIIGPLVLNDSAQSQDLSRRLEPPFHLSQGFMSILGTDSLGRDILARVIVGAQATLIVVIGAVVVATILGFCIGIVSGYMGGWFDSIVMRVADILMTVPSLLLALAVLFVLPDTVVTLIGVLAITSLPLNIRATRAQALEVKERTFVEAMRSIGATRRDLIFRQMAPVIVPTVLTIVVLDVAVVMLEVAGLSYLGVGLQPPSITWGLMVSDGQPYLANAWWATVFPGGAITLTAFSLCIISNYFRAAQDPLQAAAIRGNSTPTRRALRVRSMIDV
jgi:peptide/nickel transport system permease protein